MGRDEKTPSRKKLGGRKDKRGGRDSPSSRYRNKEATPEIEAADELGDQLRRWLETTKFKKTFFGGVNERDVWKKLDDLNELYQQSLLAERARYDTLIRAYVKAKNAELERYRKAMRALQAENETLKQASQDTRASVEGGWLSKETN